MAGLILRKEEFFPSATQAVAVADRFDNDPYLYVFNVAEKRYFRVARHDTSWATGANSRQVTHPHPSFTPDDSAILFSSDKDGKPAIYIAKLPAHPSMLSA